MLQTNVLAAIVPDLDAAKLGDYTARLNAAMLEIAVNTPQRIAMFVAQLAVECASFTKFTENLNYNAQGLMNTWPHHFSPVLAVQYARKPEQIANLVYADRLGNGNQASGDGWKYRGRGSIQITGKSGYIAFAAASGVDVVTNPDLVATPDLAFKSGAYYWSQHNLNAFADVLDVKGCRHAINGGYNGLDLCQTFYARARAGLWF